MVLLVELETNSFLKRISEWVAAKGQCLYSIFRDLGPSLLLSPNEAICSVSQCTLSVAQ